MHSPKLTQMPMYTPQLVTLQFAKVSLIITRAYMHHANT